MPHQWILKLVEQLLSSLDSYFEIVDKEATFQTIALFEQIQFTKDQLESTKLIKYINKIYKKSPNQLLKYRLEILLNKWCEIRDFYENNRPVCESVFDAILNNDDDFFETKNIRELLHRLLKSFDKNYKVLDMATILNTIEVFEEIDITATQLITFQLNKYIRRLRRNTTNQYLSERLGRLNEKWNKILEGKDKNVKKVNPFRIPKKNIVVISK